MRAWSEFRAAPEGFTDNVGSACAVLMACGGASEKAIADPANPPTVTVSVSPALVSLEAGATQAFSAVIDGANDLRVTWAVQEGAAGGAITSAGLYTAPSAAGTYHVIATSIADASRTAAAAVSVAAATRPPPPSSTWVSGYYPGYQASMYPAAKVDFSASSWMGTPR